MQRALAAPADERVDALRCLVPQLAPQHLGDLALADQRTGDVLVMHRADLLERVRERIVSDVVEQRGEPRQLHVFAIDEREVGLVLEQREHAARQVVRAEGVLEARVRRAGVDQEGQPELPNVSEPLECRCVDQLEGERIEPDVVPERIADDVHGFLSARV